jgi:hypothetical protein
MSINQDVPFFHSDQVTHGVLLGALREEARVKKTHKGEKEIGF